MNDFLRNFEVSYNEFREWFYGKSLKKRLTMIFSVILVFAIIIGTTIYSANRDTTSYDVDALADSYSNELLNNNYYESIDYTIIGNKSIEKIYKVYGDGLKSKRLSEKNQETIKAVSDVMDSKVVTYIQTSDISDLDSFFAWYVPQCSNIITTYNGDDQLSVQVMDAVLQECFTRMRESNASSGNENKISYTIELEELYDFTDDEVDLYKKNKTEKAESFFENCKLKSKNIKEVKRYTYVVKKNGEFDKNIKFYMIRIGKKWFVDSTAVL